MRTRRIVLAGCLVVLWSARARAGDAPASGPAPDEGASEPLPPDAHIEFSEKPPQPEARPDAAPPGAPGEPVNADAPPPRPHRRGLVLESAAGVLGFAGQFRHVAPPAYWMRVQLGYELASWLMVFGEGELAFSDTSEAQVPSQERAFFMWGFGGGARGTVHASERFAAFAQAEGGAMTASVPHGAFANLGFRSAESLGAEFGVRVGVEWYPKDPHLALALQGGARDALGFAKIGGGDLPIMWDGAVALRYTF